MGRLDAVATRTRTVLTDRLAVRLHYLSLAVAFVGLLWYMRRQWFTEDDWEFIHRLIPGVGNLGLFVPHNEHWSTLPLLVYKALFAAVGLRSYVPYLAVLLALHVLAAHLMWRIMRKAGADVLVATAVTSVFLVLGSGAENLDWAFQIGFVGALAAGLGMVLAVLDRGAGRLLAAWVLGVASVMCSGLGPIMVVAAGLTALLRVGWRRALLDVSVPGLTFAVWWLLVGRHPATPSLPRGNLGGVPDYVFTGITSAAANISGLRFVGALLLLPLGWWLVVRARRTARTAAVVALAATTVLFFMLVGVGRIGLGVDESKTSRYVYICALLLLPAVAVAASGVVRRHGVAALLTALTVLWAGAHNVRTLNAAVVAVTGVREHAQARILTAAHLVHGSTPTFPGQPEPVTAPDLSWRDLVYLVDNGDLPASGTLPPSTFDTVSVEANVETAFSETPLLAPGGVRVVAGAAVTLRPTSADCEQVSAGGVAGTLGVRLVATHPATVAIQATSGTPVTVHLYASLASRVYSPPHQATVPASGTLFLNLAAVGAVAQVGLPTASTLCGVVP